MLGRGGHGHKPGPLIPALPGDWDSVPTLDLLHCMFIQLKTGEYRRQEALAYLSEIDDPNVVYSCLEQCA